MQLLLWTQKHVFLVNQKWSFGLCFFSKGVKPDPEKVKAIENIKPPKDKDEIKSLSDFIPSFTKVVALFTEWERPCWTKMHQKHLMDF